jgi:hypothetical protein
MKDITMNGKEQRRAMILTAAVEGRLTAGEAAELMSLSQRQERRLRHAFLRECHADIGDRAENREDAGGLHCGAIPYISTCQIS